MAEHRELDGFITDPRTGRHILEYDFPLNCHWMEFVVSVGGRPEQYSQRFRGETVYPIRLTRTSPTFFAGTAYIGHKREVMRSRRRGAAISENLLSKSPPALASVRYGL